MVTKRYQVFLSSTFKDLQAERVAVTQALLKTQRCIPAGMENFPSSGRPPWAVITAQLDVSDYMVLVVAGRYGSITEDGVSFTEAEYDYAIARGIPVLAFLHADPMTLSANMVETDQKARAALEKFRNKLQEGTTSRWTSAADLAPVVINSLWQAFEDQPRPGWVRGELTEREEAQAPAIGGLEMEVAAMTTGGQPLRPLLVTDDRVDRYVDSVVSDLLDKLPNSGSSQVPVFGFREDFQASAALASLFNERGEDRTPEHYRSQVSAYEEALRDALPRALDLSAAVALPRFSLSVTNLSMKNYADIRLVLHIEGDVRGVEPAEPDVNPLVLFPDPPRAWGPYTAPLNWGNSIEFPSIGPSVSSFDPGPSLEIDNGGSVTLTYPPFHLRPGATERLADNLVVLLFPVGEDPDLKMTWTATATNVDGIARGSAVVAATGEPYDPWDGLSGHEND